MNLEVRRVSLKYVEVIVTGNFITLELGLLNEEQAKQLASVLLDAYGELVENWPLDPTQL